MPGILSVVLITDLRAECAVEVKYNTSKKSSPDSEELLKLIVLPSKNFCL